MKKNLLLPSIKLVSIKTEQAFLKREKIDRTLELINGRIKRLKKLRGEVDAELEKPMPLDQPVKLRDGRVVTRVLTEVAPIIIDAAWRKKHPDMVARGGYSFTYYQVAET